MQPFPFALCSAVCIIWIASGCAMKTRPPAIPPTAESGMPHGARPAATGPSLPSPTGTKPAPRSVELFARKHLEREHLVAAVLELNPSIMAMREAWNAATQRTSQVAALDDPMASYAIAPLSIGSSRVDFGETVEVSQRFPWPGKLRLRGEAARYQAEAHEYDYETMRQETALTASDLYDDYYLVERALAINAEHVRLLEQFKDAATAQYAAGLLSQQDPIQAEVELAHLAHREVVLATERRVIVARLNTLLHRPPSDDLPPPIREALLIGVPDQIDDAVAQRLEELAIAARPELAAIRGEIAARRAEVRVAELEGYPDFGVMTSYNSMWGDEAHRWMTGVSLNLPIWRDRIRAARAEAAARLAETEARRLAMEDEIRSEVHQVVERLREAGHVLGLYRERLLPAAEDQVRAARAGVESGTNSFLALIEAEKNLRSADLGYEEAIASWQRRLARLARQLGRLPHQARGALAEVMDGDALSAQPMKGDLR